MEFEFFRSLAESNRWGMIMPEILVGGLALLLLLTDLLLKPAQKFLIPRIAMGGLALIILFTVLVAATSGNFRAGFGGLILQNGLTDWMRIFFLLASLVVCHLASIFFGRRRHLPAPEFYHIVLVITGALMLLVQSNHFVLLFVTLETVTLGFYILVAYSNDRMPSLEAGLKYLILGALSSAILLFGIVLLYGIAGNPNLAGHTGDSMNFTLLGNFIAQNSEHPLVLVGAVFVIAGLAFKIGAVPFQIWVPDVYQGAPSPVTAFLATASKAAGFFLLIVLVTGPFSALAGFLIPLLTVIAILTILFGNISALSQRNVKRLLGLSGVAHAGYLLVGVIAAFTVDWAVYAVLFYLFVYYLASAVAFGVVNHVSIDDDADQTLSDYSDLARHQPFLAGVLAVSLGSLAGIPPLGGFIAKVFLFVAAFQAGLFLLLGVSVLGVVISIYYYFGWIREVYFTQSRPVQIEFVPRATQLPALSGSQKFALGLLTALTIILGFYVGGIGSFMG
jgi:NADH-quinone oxidoreductase subunit N